MVATIQTKWKHNPGCVDIMAQKHLDRRDRSEPSYEQFPELMSRASGGARRPQLTDSCSSRPTAVDLIAIFGSMMMHTSATIGNDN